MAAKKKSVPIAAHHDQVSMLGFLGFNDIPIESKFQVAGGIGSWIHSEFLLRVVQALEPHHIEELVALARQDADNQQALMNFLQSSVPHLDDLLQESVMAVRANLSIQKNLLPSTV
jgi:hypothetical protein